MRFLLFHLLAGVFTGARFRIHTLMLVVAATLVETGLASRPGGFAATLAWMVGAEISLQIGYVVGVGLRCAVEYANPHPRYNLD